jgi:hypothetical protein
MASHTYTLCPSCPTLAFVSIWTSSSVIFFGRSSYAVIPIFSFASTVSGWSDARFT